MKRIGYHLVACTFVLAFTAGIAAAGTPAPNGATTTLRVFNDCPEPNSTASVVNSYPASIAYTNQNLNCVGGAIMHNWSFSSDGGATAAEFDNNSCFSAAATLVLNGTAFAEGGLRVSPWWSLENDGQFQVKINNVGEPVPVGEIAVFGGRLPFYSFSASQGAVYVIGTPIRMEVIYRPNGLSMASPATIEYRINNNGTPYTSGPLAFDQGNPAEDPPHGQWGMLQPAKVGGRFLTRTNSPGTGASATFSDITFSGCVTPATTTTWGRIKSTYR
jgi:hypothetical protein